MNDFSREVWFDTYRYNDGNENDILDSFRRVANAIAEAEKPELKKKYSDEFYNALSKYYFCPGGRILANAGTSFKGTTLANCYVGPKPNRDQDSLEGITTVLLKQMQTLKSEGGWGMNFSFIRPRGSTISKIGVESPGAVTYMELFNKSSHIITSGSGKENKGEEGKKNKIRKGAQMSLLDCVAAGTLISTVKGKIPIENLVGDNPLVYCTDYKGNIKVRKANRVWSKGIKSTVKIKFDDDTYLVCTPEHEIMLSDFSYKKAKDLIFGDSVSVLHKVLYKKYYHLGITGVRKKIPEHIAVAEYKYGRYPIINNKKNKLFIDSEDVHHIDENTINNDPDNILILTRSEHWKIHNNYKEILDKARDIVSEKRRGKTWEEFYGPERAKQIKEKWNKTRKLKNIQPWNKDKSGHEYKNKYKNGFSNQFIKNSNHKVISVEKNEDVEVYDISVPEFHNFVANGVFVHNCWHPDVEEFIEAKRIPNKLDKFNVSVGCYDNFMDLVEKVNETGIDEDWPLIFPETDFHKYESEWDGDIYSWLSKGYPIKTYKTVSVKNLWQKIMQSTYNFNDPGVIYLDRANKTHLLNYVSPYAIRACNPCVAEGTLVNTPNGYRKVEEIKIGDYVSTVLGREIVKNIEINHNYQTYKISFSDGDSQIVTESHKYHVLKNGSRSKKIEKIPINEIRVGDRILVTPLDMEYSSNDQEEYERGLKAGILLGDGSYMSSNIKISSSSDDVEYNNLVKKLFGINNFNKDYVQKDGSKSMSMCFKSHSIDISELGLTPQYCENKTIDYNILNNKSIIIGLLDGLLSTDGNVNLSSNHPQLRWSTCSYRLAKTIRDFLLYIGCHGFITSSNDKDGGFINGRQIVCKNIQYTITISGESFRNYAKTTRLYLIHPRKYNLIKKALSNFKLSGNCWNARVIKIEPYEICTVYDIYCEDSDTWVTSGYTQQGCGEQMLIYGGVCDLASLVLPFLLKEDLTSFDYDKIKSATRTAVRFLDNINDVMNTPCEEYKKNAIEKRRIGLGIMGWGSALYLLKTRFGSDKAEQIKYDLMKTIVSTAVETSTELAKEKGAFVNCDKEALANHVFFSQLDESIKNKIRQNGLRNSSLFSIQPNGNTSILMGIVSGGCEPIFMHEYIRTVIVQTPPDSIKDFCPKYWQGEFYETELFKYVKEGNETILRGVDKDGTVYKIDKNRGLTKEVLCEDYAVRILKERLEWDANADWAVTTANLTVDDHIKDLNGWAGWIDSSISKTINIPNDYPYSDFEKIYLDAYRTGNIKGITTYRAGTMTNVLSSVDNKPDKVFRRPKKLPCHIHHLTVKGRKYYAAIGMLNEKPYEIFVGENGFIDSNINTGFIQRIKDGKYALIHDNEVLIDDMCELCSDEEEAIARLSSINLRSGTDVKLVVNQLEKTKGNLSGFTKAMCRVLKKYIPIGTTSEDSCPECKNKLVYSEGCVKCVNCSYSKC